MDTTSIRYIVRYVDAAGTSHARYRKTGLVAQADVDEARASGYTNVQVDVMRVGQFAR